jgi:hypothetical protein
MGMRRLLLVAGLAATLLAAGCTHNYSVKIDGDVQGTDKDTPRAVPSTVIEGGEATAARQAGLGHLKPLTDAQVTVGLKMKGEDQPRAWDTYPVDSRSAEFHVKKEGEGKLAWVIIKVAAKGRKPIEKAFPSPGDVPFEATVMAVLDEALPETTPPINVGPSTTNPASSTPK